MDSPIRRTTRSALLDLQRNIRTPTTASANIPDSILTPSPDEQVIRQRGRRKTCPNSADGTLLKYLQASSVKTPTKCCTKSPFKSPIKRHSLPTRTSPRKRLVLDDTPEVIDIDVLSLTSSPAKRVRISSGAATKSSSTQDCILAIKGLSHHQLLDIFVKLVERRPDLQQELMEHMPVPDISDLENNLKSLKKNIFKSFPYTKWGSKRDAFCYRRVSVHLTAFKKTCVDQGKQFLSCNQWTTAIDYVLMAWSYVYDLPDWDNEAHNKLKQSCFKSLATQCMNALKKGKFSQEYYQDIESRFATNLNLKRKC
ncbi:hypothetical protein CHUAL_001719 [Chamberlinius hualienensis]